MEQGSSLGTATSQELFERPFLHAPKAPPAPPRSWRWLWLSLAAVLGLVAGFGLGAPGVVERFAKHTLNQLSQRLGIHLAAEEVSWTLKGELTAHHVTVRSLAPGLDAVDSLLATITKAELKLSPDLWGRRAQLERIHLEGVDGQIVRTPDGISNLDALLARLTEEVAQKGSSQSSRRLSFEGAEVEVSNLRLSIKHGFQGLSRRLRLPERIELRQGQLALTLQEKTEAVSVRFHDTNLDPGFGLALSLVTSHSPSEGLKLGPLGYLQAVEVKPARPLRVWLGQRVLGIGAAELSAEHLQLSEVLISQEVKDTGSQAVDAALAAGRITLHGQRFNEIQILRQVRDALMGKGSLRALIQGVEVDALALTVSLEDIQPLLGQHTLKALGPEANGELSLVGRHDALALSLARPEALPLAEDASLDQRWAHVFGRLDQVLSSRIERTQQLLALWDRTTQDLPDLQLSQARVVATHGKDALFEFRDLAIQTRYSPTQRTLKLSFEHPFGEGQRHVSVEAAWGEQTQLQLSLQGVALETLRPFTKVDSLRAGHLSELKLKMVLPKEGQSISVEGQLKAEGLMLDHPALAQAPVGPFPLEASGLVKWDKGQGAFSASELHLISNAFDLTGEVAIHSALHRPKLYAALDLKEAPVQALWRSIPRTFVPLLADAELSGDLAWSLRLMVDSADVDNLTLDSQPKPRNLQVHSLGPLVDFNKLRRSHTYRIRLKDGSEGQRVVGPQTAAWVHLADMSPYLALALTTTEDGTFSRNPGISTFAMRESLATNLKRNAFVRGASTITQQLVKNLFLGGQKTLSRKLQEIAIAWQMSLNLTKNEVMALYLNTIEFGPGLYGIGDASWHYFGKRAMDLTLSESVFLASIVPGPRKYYAFFEQGGLTPRWQGYIESLMKVMVQREKITEEEWLQAAPYEVRFRGRGGGYRASSSLEGFDQIPEHDDFEPSSNEE